MSRLESLASLIALGLPYYLRSQYEQLSFWVKHGGYWNDSGLFDESDINITRTNSSIYISRTSGYFEFENITGSQITITSLAFSIGLGLARTSGEIIDDYPVNIVLEPNQKLRLTEIKLTIT